MNPRSDRRGYAMLLAMLLIAILAVIGATTLSVAGVDQRIALHNRKHMMVLNTSSVQQKQAYTSFSMHMGTITMFGRV